MGRRLQHTDNVWGRMRIGHTQVLPVSLCFECVAHRFCHQETRIALQNAQQGLKQKLGDAKRGAAKLDKLSLGLLEHGVTLRAALGGRGEHVCRQRDNDLVSPELVDFFRRNFTGLYDGKQYTLLMGAQIYTLFSCHLCNTFFDRFRHLVDRGTGDPAHVSPSTVASQSYLGS